MAAPVTNLSNITSFLRNQTAPPNSLFLSTSSQYPGSTSMMSFEGAKGCNGSFFSACAFEQDEYFHQPEKKRRLSANQVQFLEKSFEEEDKLEPERKTKLAKDLGLQPRQVAIWFQNRRARWKTKQMEKDYDTLHQSYETLKANYDILLKEKDKLKTQVASLTEKVLLSETGQLKEAESGTKGLQELEPAQSDILDSDSQHYTLELELELELERGDSSYVFEPDQSDLSQDEEDNLSRTLFPKLEHVDYSDPRESSCNFGFQEEEDHALWTWAY